MRYQAFARLGWSLALKTFLALPSLGLLGALAVSPGWAAQVSVNACDGVDAGGLAAKLGFSSKNVKLQRDGEGCEIIFADSAASTLAISLVHYPSAAALEAETKSMAEPANPNQHPIAGLGASASLEWLDGASKQEASLQVVQGAVKIELRYLGAPLSIGRAKAEAIFIAAARPMMGPATRAASQAAALRAKAQRCDRPGWTQDCPLPIDLTQTPQPLQRDFRGPLTPSRGGYYAFLIDGGKTLSARVAGPPGALGSMQCEHSAPSEAYGAEIKVQTSAKGACLVGVAIDAGAFKAWGDYSLHIELK